MAKTPTLKFTNSEHLETRLAEIRADRARDLARLVVAERLAGAGPSDEETATQGQALELLNGAVAGLVAPKAVDAHADVIELRRKIAVADEALRIGENFRHLVVRHEAADRWKAAEPEFRKRMRAVAAALFEFEHALQERDTFVATLRVGVAFNGAHMVPGMGWAFPRIRLRAGIAYEFLRTAAAQGWISQGELEAELERADKAARWSKGKAPSIFAGLQESESK